MPKFFVYTFLCLLAIFLLSSCMEQKDSTQKKVERPVEYDQFGNKVIYTADGEKEVIDEDCD